MKLLVDRLDANSLGAGGGGSGGAFGDTKQQTWGCAAPRRLVTGGLRSHGGGRRCLSGSGLVVIAVVLSLVVCFVVGPPVARGEGDGTQSTSVPPADLEHAPAGKEQEEVPVSDEERDAMATYFADRKDAGLADGEKLYKQPIEDVFFQPYEHLLPETALEHARYALGYIDARSEFLSTTLPYLAGKALGDPLTDAGVEQRTFRIGGIGFMLSEKTVKTYYCPTARRVAVGTMEDFAPKFIFASPSVREGKMFSPRRNDFGEAALTYVPCPKGKVAAHQLVAVYEVTKECLLKFLWMERFSVFTGPVIFKNTLNKKKAVYEALSPQETVTAIVTQQSSTHRITRKIGHFRFYEIVEELALDPQGRQLSTILSDSEQQELKERCEFEDDAKYGLMKEHRREPFDLRSCFFKVERGWLLELFLGGSIFKRQMMKRSGSIQLWTAGVTPSAVYVRAVLCGALEESFAMFRNVLDNTFLSDCSTLGSFLKLGLPALRIPPGSNLSGPYRRALDCSAPALVRALEQASAFKAAEQSGVKALLAKWKIKLYHYGLKLREKVRHLLRLDRDGK